MRVAYVITRADAVGGASVHVRDLARALVARGCEARVFVGGQGPVTDQLRAAGVPFHSLRFLRRDIHPVRDVRALAELERALAAFQPDLVSTHTAKAGWIGRAVCARLGLPAIYTPHGWAIANRISRRHGPLFRAAERVAARWASAIVCVSEYERRLALTGRVAPMEKLHVVHNGVRDVPSELRADPGATPVRIVSVARFERPKDHRTLLEALARLRGIEWELDAIGDGPLERDARARAGSLGLESRVRWLGYQADPAPTLARAGLFVLSSRSEGFPRSVLEAMRAGLPVAASDVGGVGEAVAEGRSGLLASPGDVEALVGVLRKLLSDAALRRRFGLAGRQIYEERFGFERMLESTLAIYAAVIDRFPEGKKQLL